MNGLIFNIQRFSINDGPGIRTTVFFKGCPLRCKWCHNPESQKTSPELLFLNEKCVGCGKCVSVCKNNVHVLSDKHHIFREFCTFCGECENICSADALELAGKSFTAEDVMKHVMRDKLFYDSSGGGITLSGGEPFLQFDFMLELLKLLKENGLHTCIETCGFTDTKKIIEAAAYTDIFLFDWKITDSVLHKEYTGVDNALILKNLKALDENGSKIILRCPIIPGINDNMEHFKGIADIANSLKSVIGIDIAPYHELGLSKLARLERASDGSFSVPDDKEAEYYISAIQSLTDIPVKRM